MTWPEGKCHTAVLGSGNMTAIVIHLVQLLSQSVLPTAASVRSKDTTEPLVQRKKNNLRQEKWICRKVDESNKGYKCQQRTIRE